MALMGSKKNDAKAAAAEAAKEEKPSLAETVNEAGKEVATVPKGGAPAFLQDRMEEDAGKGVSTDQEDNLVPLIYVLQGLSPQCNDQDAAYIEGAKQGAIWLRNAPDPIVSGKEGVDFQPCYFYKDWVEWIPRDDGGGFVGRHIERPKEAVERPDAKDPTRMIWTMPNGNQLKETRYHVGRIMRGDQRLPFVIPLSGTGHTVSRAWMFMLNSKRSQAGKILPSYASVFHLTTKMRKNKKGTWFVLEVNDAGFVETVDDYDAGKNIFEAFAAGELKADTEVAVGQDDGGTEEHTEASAM